MSWIGRDGECLLDDPSVIPTNLFRQLKESMEEDDDEEEEDYDEAEEEVTDDDNRWLLASPQSMGDSSDDPGVRRRMPSIDAFVYIYIFQLQLIESWYPICSQYLVSSASALHSASIRNKTTYLYSVSGRNSRGW